MYKVDPDDSTKQVPKGLPETAWGSIELPPPSTVRQNPDHVFINQTGSYYFSNNNTASIGSLLPSSSFAKGMIVRAAGALPFRLDIHPSAWSGSMLIEDGASAGQTLNTGDVTFVYRGGL
jgi:hypothetical protein|tara:strand:- start:890 stop:1249 length:360 start_codon:yes stop_codon:yes gene_type:complete